ncbi:MAG: DUF4440 domain-containing protein [Sphingomonadales bacterium 28-64-96]|nr:MAG: DUF4440 domain-containing protein [Sphingomonadales bacterium 28-64-96]
MKKLSIFHTTLLLATVAGPALAQAPVDGQSAAAVRTVLAEYRSAIESKDLTTTPQLFAVDSEIFESGGSEGTYANYMAHHLAPELAQFKSFRFADYKVDIKFEGPVAIATETYRYTIELPKGAPIERKGVQTSVLRQSGGKWQIVSMHSSSRKPK